MTRDEALAALREVVVGIDQDETETDIGWWETGAGAAFGARKLHELEELIARLTHCY